VIYPLYPGPRGLVGAARGPERSPTKGDYLDYQHALAAIVDALNDADHTLIGDPREGVYKVAFTTSNMKDAMERARQLAKTGIIPRTSIEHDSFGTPIAAQVTIYAKGDQKHLFECTETQLSREQRQRFEDLVLARGPIPDEILEKIWISHHRGGRKLNQIAERMTELGVIAGMGGKRWTGQKVQNALAEYERRRDQHQEAA
jgi:hypothetical protein